jgi:hypothetical protein
MRNILEATKTYTIGKTYSFSGGAVFNRQLKPCNFLTSHSSTSFSVVILPPLFFTYISKPEAISSGSRSCLSSDELIYPVNPNLPVNKNSNDHTFSVNTSTSVYKSYNVAHWAYCIKLKVINKFDCTITPSGNLKVCEVRVNQVLKCTLGEVATRPDYPFITSFISENRKEKPINRV